MHTRRENEEGDGDEGDRGDGDGGLISARPPRGEGDRRNHRNRSDRNARYAESWEGRQI